MLGIGGDGGIVVVVMMVTTVLRVAVVIRKPLSAFALNPLFCRVSFVSIFNTTLSKLFMC